MRLIEADELMDFISEHAEQIQYAIEHKDMEILESLIKQIPTAYDVDKVIEEIEEWTARINVINDKSGKVGQVDVIGSNKAIKIVEGGGVSGDN